MEILLRQRLSHKNNSSQHLLILHLFFVVLFSNLSISYSQVTKTDSLLNRIRIEKIDTAKVVLYSRVARVYRSNNQWDSALHYLEEGLALSKKIQYVKGEVTLLNLKGVLLAEAGHKSEALEIYLHCLKINEEISNYEGMAQNLNNIGNRYTDLQQFRAALTYYLHAYDAAIADLKSNPAKEPYLVPIGNLSNVYRLLKQYDSARYYADMYYSKAKEVNNPQGAGAALVQMGQTYLDMGEYNLALEYYRSSIPWFSRTANPYAVSPYLADVFEKTGKLDSALYYGYRTVIPELFKKLPPGTEQWARMMASIHKKKNNKDSALRYLDIAFAAKDSFDARAKLSDVSAGLFNEQMRQAEKEEALRKSAESRKRNLQYAGIALGAVILIILFLLLSHSIIANKSLIRFLGVIALLIVFEFLNLLLHPWLEVWTHHSPVLMLLIMVGLAALLVPVHHKMESWIINKLIEKNQKIRLESAKRTIAKLEK
jgi:tetratricopeptide (TPR) repeat protein